MKISIRITGIFFLKFNKMIEKLLYYFSIDILCQNFVKTTNLLKKLFILLIHSNILLQKTTENCLQKSIKAKIGKNLEIL